jgi:integrase
VFGLRWQDIDLERARLTVARSYRTLPKSNKPRHLPLPADLLLELRAWREVCPATPEGLLCPVYYDGAWKMSSSRATHGLPEALRAAGCPPLLRGWHSLRHTMASTYVGAGGSILALQKILGHTSVNQTMIYAHLAPDYLAQELDRVKY